MAEQSAAFDAELVRMMDERPKIVDATKNLMAQEMAAQQSFSQTELLAAVQLVLKTVRDLAMLDPVEWGAACPQTDAQSGIERVEQILLYKAAHALHRQAQSKQQSSCKLLGKSFLRVVWPQVVQSINSNNNAALDRVLASFAQSLNSGDVDNEEVSLVWAEDFAGALAKRQQARVEQAELRLQQQDDAVAASVRAALAGGGGQEEEEEEEG